jgi:UDPglucose 6-dehydrogenase
MKILREGKAIGDFLKSDRIVLGAEDEHTKAILAELYNALECPKQSTDIKVREYTLYGQDCDRWQIDREGAERSGNI